MTQTLDREGLIGRALSASYVPKNGPALDNLVRGLTDLYTHHADAAGTVRMVYRTRVFLAEAMSGPACARAV